MAGSSDGFVAGEEIGDLEGGGIRSIRAVSAIIADAGAKIAANCARGSLLGIGGAHGVAPLIDGVFGLQDEGEDLPCGHKLDELAEKWALFVNSVEAGSFAFGEEHRFYGHDAEPGFVNARENLALQVAGDGIGFDESERAFESQDIVLRMSWSSENPAL